MSIVERLKVYLNFKGISVSSAEKEIGLSNGSLSKPFNLKTNIKTDTLEKFLIRYQDISASWLLYEEGEMLKEDIPAGIKDQTTDDVVNTLKSMAKEIVRLEMEVEELKKRQDNTYLQRVAEDNPKLTRGDY